MNTADVVQAVASGFFLATGISHLQRDDDEQHPNFSRHCIRHLLLCR